MARYAPRDEVLFLCWEMGDLFGCGGGGRPGPGGEFVDEVVAREDEFFGGNLAGGAEGGGMGDGGPFVTEDVEGGADGLHGWRLKGSLKMVKLAESGGLALIELLKLVEGDVDWGLSRSSVE